jgi:hypothetical protein
MGWHAEFEDRLNHTGTRVSIILLIAVTNILIDYYFFSWKNLILRYRFKLR